MKKNLFFRPSILPLFTLIAGGVGFVLRLIFIRTQMDASGLLSTNQPLSILLYALTACTLLVLFLCVRPLKAAPDRCKKMFRKSNLHAFGCGAAVVGVLIIGFQQILSRMDILSALTMLMAVVATGCFVLLAFARRKGATPHYLVHVGIIVFFMLQLITLYRTWSPESQLSLYLFPLLASVCLLNAAYQAVCLDERKSDRRAYVFFNQAALYFCFLSLTDKQWPFYLGMAVFFATNLCTLRVSRPRFGETSEAAEDTRDNTGEA